MNMNAAHEFYYRMPHRTGGLRPGSHRGSSHGAGQEFVSHMSLYDRPDPRRLDLRASLRNVRHDWLIHISRQRVSVPVHVVVDVSASMAFGAFRPKLHLAADFVEVLGRSTFRAGDKLGMVAFDAHERLELFVPARLNRGIGEVMSALLRQFEADPAGGGPAGNVGGLESAVTHVTGRPGMVFLVSDFHFPLESLRGTLDSLVHMFVVPMVVWDTAEIDPPDTNAIAALRDAESGVRRTLLTRPKLRDQWRGAVARRREVLDQFFAGWSMRTFYLTEPFDSDAMSQYFFEVTA